MDRVATQEGCRMNWGARTVVRETLARVMPRLSGDANPISTVANPVKIMETVHGFQRVSGGPAGKPAHS